ncbi:MAG: MCD, Malonyl-CoA decarboxylase MCD [Alphaproteobacteria bacterium]|nr:MAG: MCD, Malonyl-CoA decarboxylase MCD [Alphaproteobacteria bacterium]
MRPSSVFNDIIVSIAERSRSLVDLARMRATPGGVDGLLDLCRQLVATTGEVSIFALAQEIHARFAATDPADHRQVFRAFLEEFGVEQKSVRAAVDAYLANPDEEHAVALHETAEPRRQELLRRLNLSPGGTRALVRMRTALLAAMETDGDLALVDRDFVHLFTSWFNRGFLELQHMDWHTPAAILDKIIAYEAVHEISDWDDLRRRIDPPDRRLYAFFHPRLTDDPLIFVEVALTAETPDNISAILSADREPADAKNASTAVFYSISNCQEGLRGISFGNFLIKQVIEDLRRELPGLKTFVTLSPLPKFAGWLRTLAEKDSPLLSEAAREALPLLNDPHWWQDPDVADRLASALMPLASWHLLRARNAGDKPIDPVARFHLGNGARLERLNWLADTSENGLEASHGIMVNYLYKLDDIEKNHEAFANSGVITASGPVKRFVRALPAAAEIAAA